MISSSTPKIVCVGRNYPDHCTELNNPLPLKPILFLKPPSSLSDLYPVTIPSDLVEEAVHYELELVVVIGKTIFKANEEQATQAIAGYRLGLDLTDRSAQQLEKQQGVPWLLSKCRDGFLPLTSQQFSPEQVNLDNTELVLEKNGKIVQNGNTKDMLFKVPYLLSYISSVMTLVEGDLVMTGTPPGVGPLRSSDHLCLRCRSFKGEEKLLDFCITTVVR
eukprot:GHVS01055623.1.p1 GENE.GHVS01055623.1~~GHVS01055623.1.p1  ORF type:complete len:219 (+),score=42.93 GHVS01055623.1:67-723(+)